MTAQLDLGDPTAVLLAVASALRAAGIDAAVYGGLALAAYGEPRETRDADLAVAGVGGAQGVQALRQAGLDASLSFDHVRFGGNWVTRIALLGGPPATGLNVADLVEPRSPRYARAALARALSGTLRGEPVTLLCPEDFILFKVLSTRERDLEDAATVLRALGPRIALSVIESEAATLAGELPDHGVSARLAALRAAAGV